MQSWKSFPRMLLPLLLLLLSILSTWFQNQGSYFFVESFNFSFDSFNSDSCNSESRLICWGSVSSGNGSLYLTPELPQQQEGRKIGRVLFRYPINAWPASFFTTFTVRILTNTTVSGDGIAFVIAQDDRPSPSQSFGSYIGMLDPSTEGGVLRQLAVELDTYQNEHEIDGNHMAIVTTSVEHPVVVKSLTTAGIDLRSGRDITVKIDYDGWNKNLQMSVAYTGINPFTNFLSQEIVMEDTVPQSAYVGFTASTAYFAETHEILGWNFTSFELDKKSLKQGLANSSKEDKKRIVLSVVIPTILVLFLVLLFIVQRGKMKKISSGDIEMLTRNAANAPRFYTYRQLAKATRNFSKENLVGAGGFGCVYKGLLLDDHSCTNIIAVKKINATSGQGEREYLAEICTIGRLRHKNLVQLQGWCHYKDQLFLVYEYMPNGSLDRYIGKIFLDWKTRFSILTGLASALLYLHEECGNPVVHRDVKPNNVMLDSKYNAHLGDFGLARILLSKNDDIEFVTTMVAGTPGYLAPEVSYTGRATPESDVYSFGMVVLEVVCGRRTRGVTILDENSLVDHVWSKHEKGELLASVDPTLLAELGGKIGREGEEERQMRRTLLVGLACLHPDRMYRPRMRKVVQIFLNGDEPLMKLPKSRPIAVSLSLRSCSSSSAGGCGTDSMTKTLSAGGGSVEYIPDEMTVVFDHENTDDTKRECSENNITF